MSRRATTPRLPTLPKLLLLTMLLSLAVQPPWQRLGYASAVAVVDHRPDDESLLVVHEVDYVAAIAKARNLTISTGPRPGCKSCTSDEMRYCRNGSVLEDHCCCDYVENEELGFVEHTCRLGSEACRVRAGDCAEYTRLRVCCCDHYLASLWKYKAGGASSTLTMASTSHYPLLMGLGLLVALHGVVR